MYKVFVGGLPFSTTDDELRDRESGRSKGFGFVEFEDTEEGKAAEKALNGSELGGRSISVAEARPKEDRPRSNNW
jgi:RNA recognition motif-containing protein